MLGDFFIFLVNFTKKIIMVKNVCYNKGNERLGDRMEFVKKLIIFAPTILFCLILLWEILSGLRRGLRKSVILFINMALALTISIVIFEIMFGGNLDTKIVGRADFILGLFNTSLQDLFNTSESYTKLSEYLYVFITNNMKEFVFTEADLLTSLSLAMALAQSIVKIIGLIFVLLMYCIFKFIFYIVYLIFFKEGRRKKKINQEYELGNRSTRYKRRALFGALVGLGRGIVLGVLIFSFIGSFFYIFTDGRYSKEEETFVTDDRYYINEIANMVNQYGTVGIGSILESAKNPNDVPFYLLIADALTVGKYEVSGENPKEGSIYLRKELAPIVSMVKDAYLVAFQYGVDLNQINDSGYLSEFLKKEVDGISFADRVDSIIDRYSFGEWTLLLSQSLLNAVANSIELNPDSKELGNQILYYVLAGEHAIKAEDLVTNENINSVLKFAICAVKNMDELEEFGNRFTESDQAQLAYGVKRTSESATSFSGVTETIRALDNVLNSLDGVKNELITDIVVVLVECNLPEFSLEGVKLESDEFSAYKIKWKEDIYSLLDIVCDTVDFIAKNNIYTSDELIEKIVNDLDNEDSVGSKLIDNLTKSDLSGILLNAKGFTSYINSMLETNGITFISLPSDIVYGNYYNANGEVVRGELCNLIHNAKPKIKTVYNVIMNSKTDSELLNGLISKENGLFDLVSNVVDDTSESYSKLIHSLFSQALINFDELNVGFRIVIDEDMINSNGYIKSAELKDGISTLSEFVPYFMAEEIDYSSLITVENVEKIKNCKLLYATGSVLIYDLLSQMEQIGKYIPASYKLDTDDNIKANLSKWTDTNGELLTIVNAVIDCELIDVLFKDESNINYADIIFNDVEGFSTTLEHAIDDSVLLNCILTGIVTEIDLGDFAIKIPTAAQAMPIDGLKRIKGNQISGLIDICKDLGLDEIIKNALSANEASIDPDSIISKILGSSNDAISSLFKNYVLNATITNFLSGMLNDSSVIDLVIPVECYDEEVDNNEHLIVDSTEYEAFINVAKIVFETEDESGNKVYSYNNINYNNILQYKTIDTILTSNIFCATLSYFIVTKLPEYASDFIAIPSNYICSKDELTNEYSNTAWSTTNEFKNVFYAICDLGIEFDQNNEIAINAGSIMTNLLADGTIDRVLNSNIIHLSVSKIMMNTPQITVVDGVKEAYSDTEVWIKSTELKEMIHTLNVVLDSYDFSSLESFDKIGSVIEVDSIVDKIALMDFEEIKDALGSIIIQSTLSQTLLDNLSTVDVEYISIPNSISSKGIYSMIQMNEDGSMKNEDGELFRILEALYALDKIDILKGSIDVRSFLDSVLTLNDSYDSERTILDVVSDSKVIWYTLTKYINSSSVSVVDVPKAALDVDGEDLYLKRTEASGLVNALNRLNIDINSSEDINIDTLLSNVSNNADVIADLINNSYIIRFTLTKKLMDYNSNNEDSTLSVPNAALETEEDDLYVKCSEITALMNAIKDLDIDISTSGGVDINTILNNTTNNADTIANLVNDSYIIRYTLTKIIEDISNQDNSQIKFANAAKELYTETNEVFISQEEVLGLVGAVKTLGITSLETVNIEQFIDNDNLSTVFTDSYIMKLALTDKLLGISSIVVPYYARTIIQEEVYIKDDEITNLVVGVQKIGMNSFSSIEIDDLLNVDNISGFINSSYILRATIYDKLKNVNSIDIPNISLESLASDEFEETDILLSKAEVTGLITVITSLSITSFDSVTISTFLANIVNGETLNQSDIIRYTITNAMLKEECPFDVPNAATAFEQEQMLLTKDEIVGLVGVIKALGLADFNDFNMDEIFGGTTLAEDLANAINESFVVRYTITQKMNEDGSPLKTPNIALEINEEQSYITKNEMVGLVKVIKKLDISNFNDFTASTILGGVLTDAAINESYTVRYAVSNQLIKESSPLDIPSVAVEKLENQEFITKSEITALINVISGLQLENFNDFNATTILNGSLSDTLINDSYIIRYSVTNKISNDTSSFNIPKNALERINDEAFITEAEITSFMNSISGLSIGSFESYDVNSLLASDGIATKISNSLILRYTFTNSILNVSAFSFPTVAFEDLTASFDSTVEMFITKSEIAKLISALNEIGFNLDNVNVSLESVISKIDTVILSDILYTTISDALFEAGSKLNEPDLTNRTMVLEDSIIGGATHYTISRSEILTYFAVASSLGLDSYGESISFDGMPVETVYSTIGYMINSQIILCTYSDVIVDWFVSKYYVSCPTVDVTNVYISSTGEGTLSTLSIVDKDQIISYI